MKTWTWPRRITVTAAFACLVCLTPATARATDWSLSGSYWDTDSIGDSYGVGLRATFFPGKFQMELGATYYEQFSSEFVVDVGSETFLFAADTEVIPIELGFRYNVGTGPFYLAGGGAVYSINSNVDDLDDEWGLYYRAGLQFPRFFVEVGYRDVEDSIDFDLDLGFDDDDHGFSVTDSRLGLSGVIVNVGWTF